MLAIIGRRYRCKEHCILPQLDQEHKPFIREDKIVTVIGKNYMFVEVLAEYVNGNETHKIPVKAFNKFFELTNDIETWKERL